MIKNDEKHFMFIEPKGKKLVEVNDELTAYAKMLTERMTSREDYTKGWHSCACGKANSSNVTYSVNLGDTKYITNSLLLHYVQFHRSEIPEFEMEKLLLGYKKEFGISLK